MWLWASLAWAKFESKAIYPAQQLSAKGIERIEIRGVRGALRVTGRRQDNYRLRVMHSRHPRFEDWSLLVERRGPVLVLEVSNASYGRQWQRQLQREEWPEFDIELEGPSLPLAVSWREGQLNFRRWSENVQASFLAGRMNVERCEGQWDLQTPSAHIDISRFHGDMRVKGEGYLRATQSEGKFNIQWLQGQIDLSELKVDLDLEAQSLGLEGLRSQGEWKLNVAKGSVRMKEFAGKLTGRGQASVWTIRTSPASEVDVISQAGSVLLEGVPGAKVFLTSDKGRIRSPYKTVEIEGRKVAQGRRPTAGAGQVFVRTGSGDITFKY